MSILSLVWVENELSRISEGNECLFSVLRFQVHGVIVVSCLIKVDTTGLGRCHGWEAPIAEY